MAIVKNASLGVGVGVGDLKFALCFLEVLLVTFKMVTYLSKFLILESRRKVLWTSFPLPCNKCFYCLAKVCC